jgi:hypothetical protein
MTYNERTMKITRLSLALSALAIVISFGNMAIMWKWPDTWWSVMNAINLWCPCVR